MEDQPNLAEITQTLEFIEGRDASTTSVSRYDSDHAVLISLRERVAPLVIQLRNPGSEEGRPAVVALLDRIENAIEDNRAKREKGTHASGS